MTDKPAILVQLDTDLVPSMFDRVVAVDAGAQHVFTYFGVTPAAVRDIVHGCIFTRGPKSLHRTAIFVGGSDVTAGEAVLAEVRKHLLPAYGLSVSVMLDSNGANTTAVAAVRAAGNHLNLANTRALVLGGTGPVGQRVARLLAREGSDVRIGSRQRERAEAVCVAIRQHVPNATVTPVTTTLAADAPSAMAGVSLVVAAGAAGVVLFPTKRRADCPNLQVAIDLNAVPPTGIEWIDVADKGKVRDGVISYGALGVGDAKMKLHKRAIARLFESNDTALDADELYDLAGTI